MAEIKITGKLLHFRPVASWGYKIENDTCVICSSKLTSLCIECELSTNITDCCVMKGQCGHAFHKHCIEKWTNQATRTCPVDNNPWIIVTQNMDNRPNLNQRSNSMSQRSNSMNQSNNYMNPNNTINPQKKMKQ
jgi:RING-box protein 1